MLVQIVVHGGAFSTVALAAAVHGIRERVCWEHVFRLGCAVRISSKQATEETAGLAVAGGVVVLGAGAKSLLSVVVASKSDSHENGDDEKDDCDDGKRQAGALKPTGHMIARKSSKPIAPLGLIRGFALPERGIEIAFTAPSATLVRYSNVDEGANESDIEKEGQKGRKGATSETAEKEQGGKKVETGKAGNTLDSTDGGADGDVVVV